MPQAIIAILIRCAEHHPQRGQQGPWLPGGGAGRPNGLTEGVLFVEWHQLKVTDYTPFAANAARNRGMIATGNHYYLDSLHGAPPQRGQQGNLGSPVGELAARKG